MQIKQQSTNHTTHYTYNLHTSPFTIHYSLFTLYSYGNQQQRKQRKQQQTTTWSIIPGAICSRGYCSVSSTQIYFVMRWVGLRFD
ncbi:MAG: hypothetical protein IPJ66_16560 [Bacteroidetes bacterium]|nr:hypothetical protein [Bacteroidota bacterium]